MKLKSIQGTFFSLLPEVPHFYVKKVYKTTKNLIPEENLGSLLHKIWPCLGLCLPHQQPLVVK